jgi:hypothetical protein
MSVVNQSRLLFLLTTCALSASACGPSAAAPTMLTTPSCSPSIPPDQLNQVVDAPFGKLTVSVLAPEGCSWTATSSDRSFLYIVSETGDGSSTTGSGNGTVVANYSGNPTSSPKSGALIVAGWIVTMTQMAAVQCPVLSAAVLSVGAGATRTDIDIIVPSYCGWSLHLPLPSFVTIASGSVQAGLTTTMTLNVAANLSGAPRIGYVILNIGSRLATKPYEVFFTITQAGS